MDRLQSEFYLDSNANEFASSVVKRCNGLESNQIQPDHHQLLSIFPEEIWLAILKNLTNARDLENLSNASPFFRDLFASNATLFLFPSVFKVMAYHWTQNSNDISSLTRNCRLVCHFWNEAIQEFYVSHNALNLEEGVTSLKIVDNVTFPLANKCGITECISHFDQTHYSALPLGKNPFLGRMVVFDDSRFQPGRNANGPGYLCEFWMEISNLLVKYGNHIWYCTIKLEDKFASVEEYYFKLWEWLELMRNLKGLRVIYYKNRKRREIASSLLEETIRNNPLPKLRNLQVLSTSKLPTPILNALALCNNSLKQLIVNGKTCSS